MLCLCSCHFPALCCMLSVCMCVCWWIDMCWQAGSLHQNPASLSDRRLTEWWGEEQQSGKWEARSKKKNRRRRCETGAGREEGKLDEKIWKGWIKLAWKEDEGQKHVAMIVLPMCWRSRDGGGRGSEPSKDARRKEKEERWLTYVNS